MLPTLPFKILLEFCCMGPKSYAQWVYMPVTDAAGVCIAYKQVGFKCKVKGLNSKSDVFKRTMNGDVFRELTLSDGQRQIRFFEQSMKRIAQFGGISRFEQNKVLRVVFTKRRTGEMCESGLPTSAWTYIPESAKEDESRRWRVYMSAVTGDFCGADGASNTTVVRVSGHGNTPTTLCGLRGRGVRVCFPDGTKLGVELLRVFLEMCGAHELEAEPKFTVYVGGGAAGLYMVPADLNGRGPPCRKARGSMVEPAMARVEGTGPVPKTLLDLAGREVTITASGGAGELACLVREIVGARSVVELQYV